MIQWAVAAAAALALATGAASGPVLRRLPEPTGEPDADTKLPYASLPTRRFIVGLTAVSLAVGLTAFITQPPSAWLAWAGLAGPGALAIAVDARTTWLPRALTHATAITGAAGIVLWGVLTADWWVGGRAAIGAVAVGGFFYVLWRLTGGIGFGDVRLMVTVGAVTAAASASVAFNAVLLGSIVGAVWGIVRLRIKGPGPFPYGPALWSGPFLALALDAVSSWAIQSAR